MVKIKYETHAKRNIPLDYGKYFNHFNYKPAEINRTIGKSPFQIWIPVLNSLQMDGQW